MVVKDADAAWEQYKLQSSENSIMKASLAGQIDTLAAAMNDVNTKLDRLMPMADKVMGDEAALNSPLAQTQPDDGMGMGMDMGMGGDDMYALSDDEMGAMDGGNMPEEEDVGMMKSEEEEPVPEEVDETVEEGSFEDPVGDEATDEELAAIAETEPVPEEDDSSAGENELTVGQGNIDVPSVDSTGTPSEEMDMASDAEVPLDEVGDNPVMAAYNAFTDTLKEAAHSAIDAGAMDEVNQLADAQALMDSVWGERMRPAMDSVYKSLRKSAGVDGADAPSISGTTSTEGGIEEIPAEEGTIPEKGAPHALDNVTKSAGNGEGENEADITEFENNDQGAVPNTANPGDAGSNFVDRAEFENAMYKSSGPSIPEALEIPSFRDFAKSGDTFMESINALRKSSKGLGTELSLKKGMGSFGGMAGLIAAQDAVQKGRIEDLRSQYNDSDMGAKEGYNPQVELNPSYTNRSRYEDDDSNYLEDSDMMGREEYLKNRTAPGYEGYEDTSEEDSLGDDVQYGDSFGMEKSCDDFGSEFSEDVRTDAEPVEATAFKNYHDSQMRDMARSKGYADLANKPYKEWTADENKMVNPDYNPEPDFSQYDYQGNYIGKSCDDSVEKSSEMPVEGLENIEASEDEPIDDVGAAFAKNGKKIATFEELMNSNVQKSGWAPRPSYASSFGGDLRRPALGENIQKSAKPAVRMGYGVDPRAVTASMWDDYKLYKSRRSS